MNRKNYGCSILILTLAGFVGAGCTAREAEPQMSPPPEVVAAAPQRPALTPTAPVTTGVLQVDSAIVSACGLPTPHFAFDSSKILEDADAGLDKIAVCFTTGPLTGRSIRLVGHADPRGEVEYNFGLGQRRAGSVADYLIVRGMKAGKVTATSRGDLDAIGTDEEGWEHDRRVDMILAD